MFRQGLLGSARHGLRLGDRLLRRPPPGLLLGYGLLGGACGRFCLSHSPGTKCDSAKGDGANRGQREHHNQRLQAAEGTPLELGLLRLPLGLGGLPRSALGKTCLQEGLFPTFKRQLGTACPFLELIQPRSAKEEPCISIRLLPLLGCTPKALLKPQSFAILFYPGAQSQPFLQQRLMCQFNGRGSSLSVAIESQQSMAPVKVDDGFNVLGVELQMSQVRPEHPPAGVRNPLAQVDEAKKHLTRSPLLGR